MVMKSDSPERCSGTAPIRQKSHLGAFPGDQCSLLSLKDVHHKGDHHS